jgi:hypothetical protein
MMFYDWCLLFIMMISWFTHVDILALYTFLLSYNSYNMKLVILKGIIQFFLVCLQYCVIIITI